MSQTIDLVNDINYRTPVFSDIDFSPTGTLAKNLQPIRNYFQKVRNSNDDNSFEPIFTEIPIGAVLAFPGFYYGSPQAASQTLPLGFIEADGRYLNISEYQELYEVYGTFYGTSIRNTFRVPDLRGQTDIATYLTPQNSQDSLYKDLNFTWIIKARS